MKAHVKMLAGKHLWQIRASLSSGGSYGLGEVCLESGAGHEENTNIV